MLFKNKNMKILNNSIDNLNESLEKTNIHEWMLVLGSKREIFKRNFLAGISRGIGIGIGVTLMTAIVLLFLQKIIALNIPVIGEFVTDVVDIVQKNK